MEALFHTLGSGAYLVLVLWVLVDHGGVSLPIVAAGALAASGALGTGGAFMLVHVTVILFDVGLLWLGWGMRGASSSPQWIPLSMRTRLDRLLQSLRLGARRDADALCLFGKLLPKVGEYIPFALAWSGVAGSRNVMLLMLGNLAYVTLLFWGGHSFGAAIRENRLLLSLGLVAAFAVLFSVSRVFGRRRRLT